MDNSHALNKQRAMPGAWTWTELQQVVLILDNDRIPVNADERQARILGKNQSDLFPYYGATGQVGWIDEFLFDDERVLLGEDGAPFLESLKEKAYLIKGKSWVNNHAHVLKAVDGLTTNKYLLYYLNTFDYHGYVTGTTRYKLTQSRMREIPFPLAPLAEQRRIVAKIEELFTQLDAAEAALKRAKANLERYRQSVLQAAVTGQIVPQNSNDEPASHTIRRSWADRKQSHPELPFLIDDLPQLSEGWCWASLEQLINGSRHAMKAGPFGSALKKEFYVPTGYKIYGQEQVISGDPCYGDYYISQDLFEKLQSCEVKPGDVLVSLVGTIGKVLILPHNIEPGIINPRLVKFSFDNCIVDSRYFKYYMESQTAKDYFSITSHGQTMAVLNLGILKSLPIPLPPLNEQKRIIMEVERSESLVENQNKVVDKSLNRIFRLRQSILERAFTGRLVAQDPADQPAQVLLQKIQAERSRANA